MEDSSECELGSWERLGVGSLSRNLPCLTCCFMSPHSPCPHHLFFPVRWVRKWLRRAPDSPRTRSSPSTSAYIAARRSPSSIPNARSWTASTASVKVAASTRRKRRTGSAAPARRPGEWSVLPPAPGLGVGLCLWLRVPPSRSALRRWGRGSLPTALPPSPWQSAPR